MKSDVVRKIGFTGATPVGKILMKQAADSVKKVRRCIVRKPLNILVLSRLQPAAQTCDPCHEERVACLSGPLLSAP